MCFYQKIRRSICFISVLALIGSCVPALEQNSETAQTAPAVRQSDEAETPAAENATSAATPAVSESSRSETSKQSEPLTETSAEASASESGQSEHDTNTKTVLWKAPNGEVFYKEDTIQGNSYLILKKALYRPSTGVYYDTLANPDLFDEETYEFLGELLRFDGSDDRCVQSGDTINGYKIKTAEMLFDTANEWLRDENGVRPFHCEIGFEDDVTLTGYLLYYAYDDPTFIMKGDFDFYPDGSNQGMPWVSVRPWTEELEKNRASGWSAERIEELFSPRMYSDLQLVYLGNLFRDYPEREDLKELVGDQSESQFWKVEVTIKGLYYSSGGEGAFTEGLGSGRIVRAQKIE